MASEAPVTPPYADRVIHPLPKRRLRERLSPEAADSIKFPPSGAVGVGSGLFQYPFDTPTSTCRSGSAVAGAADGSPQQSRTVGSRPVIVDQAVSSANLRAVTGNAESSASADTAADDKAAAQPGAGGNGSQNGVTLQLQAQLTRADGYDGSENTNNKKKRKSSGNDMSMAHSGVEVRGGSMQVAATPVCRCEHDHGHRGSCLGSARSSSQYGSADLSGATVSGPGRGKYGRTRSVRNPLSNLPESRSNRLRTNEWFTGM